MIYGVVRGILSLASQENYSSSSVASKHACRLLPWVVIGSTGVLPSCVFLPWSKTITEDSKVGTYMSACVPAMRLLYIASADTNTASGMASIPGELFDASLSEVSVLRWSQHPAVSLAGLRSHRSSRCADQCCRSLLYVPTYIMQFCTQRRVPVTNVKTVDSPKAYSTYLALIEEGTAAVCSCASLPLLREMMESKYGNKLRA